MTDTQEPTRKPIGDNLTAPVDMTIDEPPQDMAEEDIKPLEEIERQAKRIRFLEVGYPSSPLLIDTGTAS